MVWACMSAVDVGRFIESILDENLYLNILENNLLQSTEDFGIQELSRQRLEAQITYCAILKYISVL